MRHPVPHGGSDTLAHSMGYAKLYIPSNLNINLILRNTQLIVYVSVPTDRRSFRTVPKKIVEDRSVQDLKIDKRTSKDLFFGPRTIAIEYIVRFLTFFSKWLPLQAYLILT